MAAPTEPGAFSAREARRIKIVCVSVDFVASLARNTEPADSWRWFRIDHGVPQDAKLVGRALDEQRDELVLQFEHDSFPVQSYPGRMFERIVPMVHTYRADGPERNEPPRERP